jgi:hypothetical protein
VSDTLVPLPLGRGRCSEGNLPALSAPQPRPALLLPQPLLCRLRIRGSKTTAIFPGLQQTGASVVPEQIRISHIAPENVEAGVARDFLHLEDRGIARCGRGQEAGAQAVAAEGRRIEAETGGALLDDRRDIPRRQAPVSDALGGSASF